MSTRERAAAGIRGARAASAPPPTENIGWPVRAAEVHAGRLLLVHDRGKADGDLSERVLGRIENLAARAEQAPKRAAGDLRGDVGRRRRRRRDADIQSCRIVDGSGWQRASARCWPTTSAWPVPM